MKETIKQYLINLGDSKISRKTVVIQSDDWGSIRMPSEKTRLILNTHPLIKASDEYTRYDTLCSNDDLNSLFSVLNSVKDKNGNSAVITANCVLANPNFEKIKNSNFEKYIFENVSETFNNYNKSDVLNTWNQGINDKVFVPQFHGREHVNFPFWLKKLRDGHKGVLEAFNHGVFGVDFLKLGYGQINFQRAWDQIIKEHSSEVDDMLIEGLNMFESQFGFKSLTATAPNYTWTLKQEKILSEMGVVSMQGILKNRIRNSHNNEYSYSTRFSNQNRIMGFQRRNVFFEPSMVDEFKRTKIVGDALKRISIAFKLKRPVNIGSHRLNFIGGISEKNRDDNLLLLKSLLKEIVKRWPDVEFLSSNDLLNL